MDQMTGGAGCPTKKDWNRIVEKVVFASAVIYCTWAGGAKRGPGPAPEEGDVFGPRGSDPVVENGGGPVRGGGDPGTARVVFQSALNGMGLPMCFTNGPDVTVQTVMVATMASASDLATLVDAPETARIRVVQDGEGMPLMSAVESALTAQFVPGVWQVLVIDFTSPVPLSDLWFGDTAGRAVWERAWLGEIKGIVCFDAPPGADVRAGVASWIALNGGFPGYPYRATYAQRKAAIEAGLNSGIDWATVIIVR